MFPSGFCFRVSCSCASEPRAGLLTARGELLWRLHLCTAIRRARLPFGHSVPTRTSSPAERGLLGFTSVFPLPGSRRGLATLRSSRDLAPPGHVVLSPRISARTPSLPCPAVLEATATRSVAGGSCTLLVSVPNSVSPLLSRSCLPVCDPVCSFALPPPIGLEPSLSNFCTALTVPISVFVPAGFCSPTVFFLLWRLVCFRLCPPFTVAPVFCDHVACANRTRFTSCTLV